MPFLCAVQALRSLADEELGSTVKSLHPLFSAAGPDDDDDGSREGHGGVGGGGGGDDRDVSQLAAAAALLAQRDPVVRQQLEKLIAGAAQGGRYLGQRQQELHSMHSHNQLYNSGQPKLQHGSAGPAARQNSLPGTAIMLPPEPPAPPPLHVRPASHELVCKAFLSGVT